MPRENRKRGKKHKKQVDEEMPVDEQPFAQVFQEDAGPSWIVLKPEVQHEELSPEAPFGYVDADVKAYFRTVDTKIREWQEYGTHRTEDVDVDPNEDRRLFFVAALSEMSGKEKQLATDPDCSAILERMAYSMDDFVRRVFLDSLAGSYEQLFKHRFASHVCQTLLTVAGDTISRETRGIFPSSPDSVDSDKGELYTLTQLVVDACEELLSSFSSLIMDPFASHVIRVLLLLLCPDLLPPITSSSVAANKKRHPSLRSKKSEIFRARQGPLKSVFAEEDDLRRVSSGRMVPKAFGDTARAFVQKIRSDLGKNEVRAMAADKVASPVLRLLLEMEVQQGIADMPDSLMDRALVEIITACHSNPPYTPEPSDYLSALLRDPTSSHVLETLVSRSPELAFAIIWSTYFKGKLCRLAVHPVANFVVAKAVERLSAEQLEEVCQELDGSWAKVISAGRSGVLRAIVDRAAKLQSGQETVVNAVYAAFELSSTEDHAQLVPCTLRLKSLDDYKKLAVAQESTAAARTEAGTTNGEPPRKRQRKDAADDPLQPTVQGALLLQSILRLQEPHNQAVLDSIFSSAVASLLAIAHHPTSSRVLDALLDSPTVPSKAKRKFILLFIGHYHLLVDDRIGSRVGDRCWASSDPYLKEKIARSLIPQESFLAGSPYGKFFARNLNLYLLQRRPDEWKALQAGAAAKPLVASSTLPTAIVVASLDSATKRKRKAPPEDEIDAVFNAALGKKTRKGTLERVVELGSGTEGSKNLIDASGFGVDARAKEQGLDSVLGAIRAAPKDHKMLHGKTKRTKT